MRAAPVEELVSSSVYKFLIKGIVCKVTTVNAGSTKMLPDRSIDMEDVRISGENQRLIAFMYKLWKYSNQNQEQESQYFPRYLFATDFGKFAWMASKCYLSIFKNLFYFFTFRWIN